MNRRGRFKGPMATPHTRLVDGQIDTLVSLVTGLQLDDSRFRKVRANAQTRLAAKIDLQPDPLSVRTQFTGLLEKLAVLGRDDIVAPLEKLMPYILSSSANIEILTLLLSLSDKPATSAEFDPSQFNLKKVEEKPLTWEEILKEEPLTGDHWKEPEFGSSDEEDEWVYDTPPFPTRSSDEETAEQKEDQKVAERAVVKETSSVPSEVTKFLRRQYWLNRQKYGVVNPDYSPELDFQDRHVDEFYLFTELDAIREVLFMLSGHECVLFSQYKSYFGVNKDYRLDHTSAAALHSILTWFADYGSSIQACRTFTHLHHQSATIQRLAAALSTHLHIFTSKLASLQTLYANMNTETASLLALQNMLSQDLELFGQIKPIITSSHSTPTILSRLFELTSQSHAVSNKPLFIFLKDIFIPTLETYFRPLHAWMTQGILDSSNQLDFFVTSSNNQENHSIFALNGNVPPFMKNSAYHVLAAGKTMDFVKHVRSIPSVEDDSFTSFLKTELDEEEGTMNPFEQAFEAALNAWISKKYSFASKQLRITLDTSSELWNCLDGLHGVYCMLNYIPMTTFMNCLFLKMNSPQEWRDRHVLTDDLLESFSSIGAQSPSVSVKITRSCALTEPLKCLEQLRVNYKIFYPISEILKDEEGVYQRIFTFLLQLCRTKDLLDRVSMVMVQCEKGDGERDAHIVHVVRGELLWFVNTVIHHIGVVVIQPMLVEMKIKMRECRDVEELTSTHLKYLSSLEYQTLLNPKLRTIFASLTDVLHLSISFVDKYLHLRKQTLASKRGDRKTHHRTGSTSDTEDPSEILIHESISEEVFLDHVKYLDDRFLRIIPFIRSGLKGNARAAEFPSLGILASTLEAGVR